MDTSIDEQWVLDDKVWRVWEQKRRLRQEKAARKAKRVAVIFLMLLAICAAFYWIAIR